MSNLKKTSEVYYYKVNVSIYLEEGVDHRESDGYASSPEGCFSEIEQFIMDNTPDTHQEFDSMGGMAYEEFTLCVLVGCRTPIFVVYTIEKNTDKLPSSDPDTDGVVN